MNRPDDQMTDHEFTTVMHHRLVIGQAMGILMERFAITAERATEELAAAAGAKSVTVYRAAKDFVRTRIWLPDREARTSPG